MSEGRTQETWEAEGLTVVAWGRGTIANCPTPQAGGVMGAVANARLIAAAPDMYEALASFVAMLDKGEGYLSGPNEQSMRDALAKAEGKAP